MVRRGFGLHPPLDYVDSALRTEGYRLVFVAHVDTSTGLLARIDELSEIAKERGTLLVVDAVSSIGGARFEFDRLGVDVVATSSQKCLAAPPTTPIASKPCAGSAGDDIKKRPAATFKYPILASGERWAG